MLLAVELAEQCYEAARGAEPTLVSLWEAMAATAALSGSSAGSTAAAAAADHAVGLGGGPESWLGYATGEMGWLQSLRDLPGLCCHARVPVVPVISCAHGPKQVPEGHHLVLTLLHYTIQKYIPTEVPINNRSAFSFLMVSVKPPMLP